MDKGREGKGREGKGPADETIDRELKEGKKKQGIAQKTQAILSSCAEIHSTLVGVMVLLYIPRNATF